MTLTSGRAARQSQEHRRTAASKARLRLWLRLLRATRGMESELRSRLRRRFETTLPRFDVMAALHRAEGKLTMTELSRHLMVSNGNVTGIVDGLVSDGMVVRLANERDRRATFVALSPEGRRQFEQMAVEHESWVDEILAGLDPDEIPRFGAMLDAIGETVARKGRT